MSTVSVFLGHKVMLKQELFLNGFLYPFNVYHKHHIWADTSLHLIVIISFMGRYYSQDLF